MVSRSSLYLGMDMNADQNRERVGNDPLGLQVKSETLKSSNKHLNLRGHTIRETKLEIL